MSMCTIYEEVELSPEGTLKKFLIDYRGKKYFSFLYLRCS
jgi:hypothetical protein